MKKIKFKFQVNGSHVHKGKCGCTNKCAIALAMLDAGFKKVSVSMGGETELSSMVPLVRYKEGTQKQTMTVQLGEKAGQFIETFDYIKYENNPVKARTSLAKRLDRRPLNLTVELTRKEAETYLVRDAYRAIPVSVRAAA